MKKFLWFLVLLFVGFALINVVFVWALSKIDWDFSKTKEAHNFKDQAYKVLVFGNSTALDGVNTEILSKAFGESYNFSLGGASLESNFVQLKHYLSQNEKPEKVLLFLSSCHLSYTGTSEVNPIVDFYYDSSSSYTLGNLPAFKFRWLFIENSKKILSKDHRSAQVIKGQLRIDKVVSDMSSGASQSLCPDYSADGYSRLNEFKRLCDQYAIQFSIFEMPCWTKSQNQCEDVNFQSTDDSNILIYNFNHSGRIALFLNPKTDWLSENHLNYQGSIKLTESIIPKIDSTVVGK